MKRPPQKAAQQSKEEQKLEEAETDNEDTIRTATLKLQKKLWPDDYPSSSDDMDKKRK